MGANFGHSTSVCVCVCADYREAGRMDYLCTVGTFHQNEGGVAGFLLIGLLADLTYCRQRKARLEGTEGESPNRHVYGLYKETNKRHLQRDTVVARRSV